MKVTLIQSVRYNNPSILQVFVYCDFHGHSRKSNVFMYGNSLADSKEPGDGVGSIKEFLNERMLPFMISQLVNY